MYLLVLKCPGLKVDFPSPDLKYIHLWANKEEKKKQRAARRSGNQRSTRAPLGRSRVGALSGREPRGPSGGEGVGRPRAALAGKEQGSRYPQRISRPKARFCRARPPVWVGWAPAAPRSGLLERLEVAVRCRPPRAPPASHSLGPVVTSGHRHLEPVKSASSSRPASVFPHPQALRAQASFECIN